MFCGTTEVLVHFNHTTCVISIVGSVRRYNRKLNWPESYNDTASPVYINYDINLLNVINSKLFHSLSSVAIKLFSSKQKAHRTVIVCCSRNYNFVMLKCVVCRNVCERHWGFANNTALQCIVYNKFPTNRYMSPDENCFIMSYSNRGLR